jgi:hypothetical protein
MSNLALQETQLQYVQAFIIILSTTDVEEMSWSLLSCKPLSFFIFNILSSFVFAVQNSSSRLWLSCKYLDIYS